MALKSFGQLMAEKRRKLRLSLRQLAALAAPCSPSHISQIEQNKYPDQDGTPQRPSMDLLDRLAAALDIPSAEARLAANYPQPLTEHDALAVEITANLKDIPPEARLIVLTQVRAVRELYAEGRENGGEKEDDSDVNGELPPENGKKGKAKPARGVQPGDPEWREPSGTIKAPPKKQGHKKPPQREREGRRAS